MMGWSRYIHAAALAALLSIGAAHSQTLLSWPMNTVAVQEQASADSVSNYVFLPAGATTGNAKHLLTLTIKIAATSGYVMVFDGTAIPANGAVTPLWCYPVTSNGTNGGLGASWVSTPISTTNGVVAAFSTTGCDILTASATAKFMGQAF